MFTSRLVSFALFAAPSSAIQFGWTQSANHARKAGIMDPSQCTAVKPSSSPDALENTSVGQIVADNPEVVRIFEDHQIDYCCHGGTSLSEACAHQGVAVSDVIVKIQDTMTPSSDRQRDPSQEENWRFKTLTDLADHIVATHHSFTASELPRISALVAKVNRAHGEKQPVLSDVKDTFDKLRDELESHMIHEEQVLFPAIRMLESGKSATDSKSPSTCAIASPISRLEHEHDDAGDALRRLRELTGDYKPPRDYENVCPTYRRMLESLENLERDLHIHIHKENNILFPRARALEEYISTVNKASFSADDLKNKSVGQIVADLPAVAQIFEDYQIDYCCHGGTSLSEACVQQGVAVSDVIDKILDTKSPSSHPHSDSQEENWQEKSLTDLADHIVATHHSFTASELPRIAALVAKVNNAHSEKQPELANVKETFDKLRDELESHMRDEEQVLFPAIRMLESSQSAEPKLPPSFPFGNVVSPISRLEHEHDDAGDALRRLRELTGGYKPPRDYDGVCMTYRRMLESLEKLELDLHIHIHKENNILFPGAKALEETLLKGQEG